MTERRVLITRPRPGADQTAIVVQMRGYAPVVLPLMEIRPRSPIAAREPIEAIVITSANALRCASPHLISELRDYSTFVVGESTAAEARRVGFGSIIVGAGTARILASEVLAQTPPGARILYLCGTPRKPVLEEALRAEGREVVSLETYTACPSTLNGRDRLKLSSGFDAALIYSVNSASILLSHRPNSESGAWRDKLFVCLSQEIADALPGDLRICVAKQPNEASLLLELEAAL